MIIDGEEFTHCRICHDLVRSEFENPDHLSSHMINKHSDVISQYHFMFDEDIVEAVQ